MVSCGDFLRDYSDYRDGLMDAARRVAMTAHLGRCPTCAKFDRLVTQGVSELRSVAKVEPSHDFLPRLQHRIYNLDEEAGRWSRPDTSGTSVAFVVMLVALIGAAAWLPMFKATPPTVELAPVFAEAPKRPDPVHALFRAGPLLRARPEATDLPEPPVNTVFFRYTPLGSYAGYQAASIRPR